MSETAVRWSRRARLDVASIYAYVADHNPRAADTLRATIHAKAAQLPIHPLAHRAGRLTGTREMVLHPTYALVYAVTGQDITILRVLHSARNWP